jgi:hypothetical protein
MSNILLALYRDIRLLLREFIIEVIVMLQRKLADLMESNKDVKLGASEFLFQPISRNVAFCTHE